MNKSFHFRWDFPQFQAFSVTPPFFRADTINLTGRSIPRSGERAWTHSAFSHSCVCGAWPGTVGRRRPTVTVCVLAPGTEVQ